MANFLNGWAQCLLICLLPIWCSASAVAGPARPLNYIFAGQELGVSTYAQGKKSLAAKGHITEVPATETTAKTLTATGSFGRKAPLAARLEYSADGRLARITLTGPAAAAKRFFDGATTRATPIKGQPGVLARGTGEAELVTHGASSDVVFSSTAWLAQQRAATPKSAINGDLVGWLIVAAVVGGAIWVVWSNGHRYGFWDGLAAAIALIAAWVLLNRLTAAWPAAHAARAQLADSTMLTVVYIFACWRLLIWSLRASRWLPGARPWHSIIAMPLMPLLLPLTVLRNCILSPAYVGLVLTWCGVAAIVYYVHPAVNIVLALPIAALLAPAVVRIYGSTRDGLGGDRARYAPAILAGLLWPLTPVIGICAAAWSLVMMLLGMWPIIAGAAVVGLFFGASGAFALAAVGLLMLPTMIGVAVGVGSASLVPTGFGNVDFGGMGAGMGVAINPGSGLPMLDGIGGFDVGGNAFGSSGFDFGSSGFDFGGGSSFDFGGGSAFD
jgi:hypothetical protein